MSTTNRLGEEVDWSDDGQRDKPDDQGHGQSQIRCSVGCRCDGVADGGVAVSAKNGQSEYCSEPVETCSRVV